MTLDEIKDQLRKRLIEYDGNIAPHELTDLVAAARMIGLEERDIAKLLPDADRTVNWAAIKEDKRIAEEARRLKKEEQLHQEELLEAMIRHSLSDGTVTREELVTIFARVAELRQSPAKIARKIDKALEKGGYKPYPAPDPKARNLKQMLLSTSWYDAGHFRSVTNQQSQAATLPPIAKAVPCIHSFQADKITIEKGESIVLSWQVSGVELLTISGIGQTRTLQGKCTVTPVVDIVYVLDAGGIKQSQKVRVRQRPGKKMGRSLTIAAIVFILCCAVIGSIMPGTGTLKPAVATDVYNNPDNGTRLAQAAALTENERKQITQTLYLFYQEDNRAKNGQELGHFFADFLESYYGNTGLRKHVLVQKLSAHKSVIEQFTFLERTPKNGYRLRAEGVYTYTPKKSSQSATIPIRDIIVLNDHLLISAIYKE